MRTNAVLTALFLTLASIAAVAQDAARRVTVDGEGTIIAQPDIARVTMAIQATNIEVREARDYAVDITRQFLALCDRLDIPDDDIHTSGLNIFPQYRWDEKSATQVLQAYLVRRQLNVELKDLDKLGELMEGAVDAGVNEVSQPQLASSRERELHREALALAARDAEANARVLAETLGVELGEVLDISASQNVVPMPMQRGEMFAARAMAMGGDGADTYSVGGIRFQTQVTASFALVEN